MWEKSQAGARDMNQSKGKDIYTHRARSKLRAKKIEFIFVLAGLLFLLAAKEYVGQIGSAKCRGTHKQRPENQDNSGDTKAH